MKGMLAQALDRATFDSLGSVNPLASATEAILKSHGGLATPMETIRKDGQCSRQALASSVAV